MPDTNEEIAGPVSRDAEEASRAESTSQERDGSARVSSPARPVLVAALAGVLLAAGFPPYGQAWLVPVGVALMLATLDRARTARQAFWVGSTCGIVFYGATLFWLWNVFGPGAVSLIVICTAFVSVFGVTYRFVRLRLATVPVWLAGPVLWTGIEYYRSELFVLKFGWMGIGYATLDSRMAAWLMSCFGSYCMSFLIVLYAAVLVLLWQTGKRGPGRAAAVYGLATAIFAIPPVQPIPAVDAIDVRLVQAPAGQLWTMLRLSRRKDADQPDFLVWPEYALSYDPTIDPETRTEIGKLTRETGAYLVVGGQDNKGLERTRDFRNTAFVLGPDGELLARHVKNHTVHLMRDGIAGRDAKSIATDHGKIGVGVCFDMDFPDVARRLAADGAEYFLVPNMDPEEWGGVQREQHRLLFRMRAAENGRWLARADVAGGASVCAPNGVEVARVHTTEAIALDAEIGRESRLTLYTQGGWRFSQVCLLAAALMVAYAGLRTWRTGEGSTNTAGRT